MEELPCDLDKLINFKNLSITIDFLYKNNTLLNQKIQDLTAKVNILSDLKEDVDNIKIKNESLQNKINSVEESVNNFSETLLKYEERFTELNNRLSEYDTTIEFVKNATDDNMKKIISHEDNLNNLNRVVEDQIKSLEKEKVNIENNTNEIEKLKEILKNYNNEISKIDVKIEENNKEIYKNINSVSENNKEMINNTNKKLMDLNLNISNLGNNIKELNSKIGVENKLVLKEIKEEKIESKPIKIETNNLTNIKTESNLNTEDNIINRSAQRRISGPLNKIEHVPIPDEIPDDLNKDDIEFIYNKLQSFDKINKASKIHYDNELNLLNQKIIQIQNSIPKLKTGNEFENIPPITNNISIMEEPSTNIDLNISNKSNEEIMKKVTETLRMFSNSIERKAPLQKIDELNTNFDRKLNNLSEKFNNAIQILENKLKMNKGISSENGKETFDYDILLQNINVDILKKVDENIKTMVQNKINEFDLSNNPNIENLHKILEEHKEELKIKRVNDSEERSRKLRFDLDQLSKLLEGETSDDKEGQPKLQGSFRDNISFLGQKIAELQNNFSELKSKVDNMNKEILTIVKRDLKNESQRILEEFKSDLRNSISKIEEQLRDKVDKFGLVEFGQKINHKLGNEMSRKIDKSDMSKNNLYISRKIDNLENKISRTLVDTLIDLQMDEAPLMTKKNFMRNTEKCASCNQPLPQNQGYYMINKSFEFNKGNNFKNKHLVKESEKLPEIK